MLLRVSAEHFVSTSHEGKYTDHFTFAWDITVSQVIINNIVFLHICIYEVRALLIKFFNPDQGPADPHQFPQFYGNQ